MLRVNMEEKLLPGWKCLVAQTAWLRQHGLRLFQKFAQSYIFAGAGKRPIIDITLIRIVETVVSIESGMIPIVSTPRAPPCVLAGTIRVLPLLISLTPILNSPALILPTPNSAGAILRATGAIALLNRIASRVLRMRLMGIG